MRPRDVFDPEVPGLTALLPESTFPDAHFRRPDILAALRPLGLRQTLGWSGLVTAAKLVKALRDARDEKGRRGVSTSSSESIEAARETGRALLTYIDTHSMRLFDGKVEVRWGQRGVNLVQMDATVEERSRERLAALQELMELSWVRYTYIFAVGGFMIKKGVR